MSPAGIPQEKDLSDGMKDSLILSLDLSGMAAMSDSAISADKVLLVGNH